jgi:hypothetical protein
VVDIFISCQEVEESFRRRDIVGHSDHSLSDYFCLVSALLTFHGASFILHAHTNLEPDSEDIEKTIIELPSELQGNIDCI